MTMIARTIAQFLDAHWDPARPVLLGLSGGPDSLALLHLLLPLVRQRGFQLHIAHVDHGWREESAAEAEQLRQHVLALGLLFHAKRLTDEERRGNLEAAGRSARLAFFRELCTAFNCQAVLLGHQADDVVETTLKRMLEGVTLSYLSGLQDVISWDGLVLWRPLLTISKQQLIDWLREQGLMAFTDHTNSDPRFLRARMRTQILPDLERQFGKRIQPGIRQIAQEADQLRQYLDAQTDPWLKKVVSEANGIHLNLVDEQPAPYELRYLLRRVAGMAGMAMSREILDVVAQAILDNSSNKKAVTGQGTVIVHRRHLTISKKGT